MDIILETKKMEKTINRGKNNEQHILRDVDLKIKRGEFVAVMGPSGSGKSTLLYNISGMDKITSGKVLLDGAEISSLSEKELASVRLQKMGFVFQHIHLLKNLSIFDNIILPAYHAKKEKKGRINEKAFYLMKKTGISALADRDITETSGGQLQRAGICRALINDPDIIFADEPTGALDSKAAEEILSLLAEINTEGKTVMIVTHDMKVASKADRVLFMLDGRIAGMKELGRYTACQKPEEREESISGWLAEMEC